MKRLCPSPQGTYSSWKTKICKPKMSVKYKYNYNEKYVHGKMEVE